MCIFTDPLPYGKISRVAFIGMSWQKHAATFWGWQDIKVQWDFKEKWYLWPNLRKSAIFVNRKLGPYLLDISFSSGISLQKRAGGQLLPLCHYDIQQETHYKNTTLQTKPQHTKQPSSSCHTYNSLHCLACTLVSSQAPPKEGGVTFCACAEGNNGTTAKFWKMHFSCGQGMRNWDPTNSGLKLAVFFNSSIIELTCLQVLRQIARFATVVCLWSHNILNNWEIMA